MIISIFTFRPTRARSKTQRNLPKTSQHDVSLNIQTHQLLLTHTISSSRNSSQVLPGLMQPVQILNTLPEDELFQYLIEACASQAFVHAMISKRPYETEESFLHVSTQIWRDVGESAKLEAFAAHPRLGLKFAPDSRFLAQSRMEQRRIYETDNKIHDELAKLNDEYFQKFGFTFIQFASGMTAQDVLQALQARIGNSYPDEICNASEQEERIMLSRLRKLLAELHTVTDLLPTQQANKSSD